MFPLLRTGNLGCQKSENGFLVLGNGDGIWTGNIEGSFW